MDHDEVCFKHLPLLQLSEATYGSKIKKQKRPFDFENVKVTDLYYCANPEVRQKLKFLKVKSSLVPRLADNPEPNSAGSANQAQNQQKIAKEKGIEAVGSKISTSKSPKSGLIKSRLRNNPFFTDPYLDLLCFECPDITLYHNIIRQIMKYNRGTWKNGTKLLLIFFEKLMKQVSAATVIQMWVSQLFHFGKLSHRLYPDTTRVHLIDQVIVKRAISCIQGFWRNYKMKRRLTALSEINKIIRRVDNPKIYIEKNIYFWIGKLF